MDDVGSVGTTTSGDEVDTSAAEAHRTEFNSAYATLEQAIRNFSKEKLMYEQTISGLKDQLSMAQQSFQKLTMDHEDSVAENKRLIVLHEENEKNRFELGALTSAVERKHDIISDTVAGLERAGQEMFSRYEEHEEFIYELKFKQLQLKKWIDECVKRIEELTLALQEHQEKLAEVTQTSDEQKKQLEEEKATFEQEISRMKIYLSETLESCTKEFTEKAEEQKKKFEEEKLSLEQEIENIKVSMTQSLEACSKDFAQKTEDQKKQFEEEKVSLEQEIEKLKISSTESLEACSKQFVQKEEEQKKQFEEEKASLEQEIEKLKISSAESLEACSKQFAQKEEEQKKQFEEEKISLQEEMKKMNLANAELIEANIKEFAQKTEEQRKQFEEEKLCLEQEMEALKISHSELLEARNKEFELKTEEQKKQFEEEKLCLKQEMENLKISNAELLEARNKEFELKTEEQKKQFEEEKISLQEEMEKMNSANAELMEAYSKEFTQKREEQKKQFEEEKFRLEQELYRAKTEKRELQKRYQDQKQAIAKMVEEVGVRPVILPSTRTSSTKASVSDPVTTPSSSQEKSRPDVARQVPKTPLLTRPPPDPMTPTRTGILKRHSFSAGDKGSRNVSFGPTFVADFVIPSDTDESNTSEDGASKKDASNNKRIKLSDGGKSLGNGSGDKAREVPSVKEVEKERENKSGKQPSSRRYLKRGIGQPKRSSLVDAIQQFEED